MSRDKVLVNATRVSHGPSIRTKVKTLVPTTWLIYVSSDVFYQGLGPSSLTGDIYSVNKMKRGSCSPHFNKKTTRPVDAVDFTSAMTLGEFFKS